jgi:intracellular multiplication protein IcmG
MTDENQNNDEYQFADLDGLNIEPESSLDDGMASEKSDDEGVSSPPGRGRFDALSPDVLKIIRKGAIAVGALVLVISLYKTIGSFFTSKAPANQITPVVSTPSKVVAPVTSPSLVQRVNGTDSTAVPSGVEAKLSSLKQEQTRIESDLSTVHKQLASVTQAVSDMTAKMDDVKQTMLVLSERMEQQANQLARVQTMSRTQRPTTVSTERKKVVVPKTIYSIQAIIPGRAWLMSAEGRTLTVSRGSAVPGYGAVRIINPELGRIFTSSGRVIQFNKADS